MLGLHWLRAVYPLGASFYVHPRGISTILKQQVMLWLSWSPEKLNPSCKDQDLPWGMRVVRGRFRALKAMDHSKDQQRSYEAAEGHSRSGCFMSLALFLSVVHVETLSMTRAMRLL